MTIADEPDEEIARAVLKRLQDRGLRSLRQMEEYAPVSRTTLGNWRAGRYEMKGTTRTAALEWLGRIVPAPEGLTAREEWLIVANWLESFADHLRRLATAQAESLPQDAVDELVRGALDVDDHQGSEDSVAPDTRDAG